MRYCEFSRVNLEKGLIDEACLHVDIIGVMQQAGHYPLPPPTGVMLNPTPGPMTHDGIQTLPQVTLPADCYYPLIFSDACYSGHWANFCLDKDIGGFHCLAACPEFSTALDVPGNS